MGGRGSSSASAKQGVSRYRIVHGDTALENLRKRGASDNDIAAIYSQYHDNRVAGMGKRDARVASENQFGFGAKTKQVSKPKKESTSIESEKYNQYYRNAREAGFSKAESKKIAEGSVRQYKKLVSEGVSKPRDVTSTTYERAQKRLDKHVASWVGRR